MESYYKQNKKLITDILDILEGHFGKNVEFVVHDLSLDYEHTIVDIRNGEVTGRKVGGTGDLLGLRALRYNGSNEGNCFNTLTYAENGKILRSSTLFFRNGAGVAVAAACAACAEEENSFAWVALPATPSRTKPFSFWKRVIASAVLRP